MESLNNGHIGGRGFVFRLALAEIILSLDHTDQLDLAYMLVDCAVDVVVYLTITVSSKLGLFDVYAFEDVTSKGRRTM